MERKHRRMTEGLLCFFSLPEGISKTVVVETTETLLHSGKSGRILGSGMSLIGDGAVTVEIGAYDQDVAGEAIEEACSRLKCDDYELTWD